MGLRSIGVECTPLARLVGVMTGARVGIARAGIGAGNARTGVSVGDV